MGILKRKDDSSPRKFSRHNFSHEEKEDGTFVLTVHANFQLAARSEYDFRFPLKLEKVNSCEKIFYKVSLKKPVDSLCIFQPEKQLLLKSVPLSFQLSNCEKKNRAVRINKPQFVVRPHREDDF